MGSGCIRPVPPRRSRPVSTYSLPVDKPPGEQLRWGKRDEGKHPGWDDAGTGTSAGDEQPARAAKVHAGLPLGRVAHKREGAKRTTADDEARATGAIRADQGSNGPAGRT